MSAPRKGLAALLALLLAGASALAQESGKTGRVAPAEDENTIRERMLGLPPDAAPPRSASPAPAAPASPPAAASQPPAAAPAGSPSASSASPAPAATQNSPAESSPAAPANPPAASAPSSPDAPAAAASASPATGFGGELQGFDYGFPVQEFTFDSQGQTLRMAYIDVAPTGTSNGRTALLLHGKNFCAGTWEDQIRALSGAGFRVIAPDQIGFCKSTKPRGYQFSFNQLALNTRALLQKLGLGKVSLVGHSMGGMLATRYALMFPQDVATLVLVNPLGLEDWQAKGVPYQSIDAAYAEELKTDAASIKAYQQKFYYGGQWQPAYDRWVAMLAGLYAGPDREIVAWNGAQTSDMIFTQDVVHEFVRLDVPTTLLIGQLDRTAPGAARAPAELASRLGDYPKLGKAVATLIPNATLVEFPNLGHAPQIQAPAEFDAALLAALAKANP